MRFNAPKPRTLMTREQLVAKLQRTPLPGYAAQKKMEHLERFRMLKNNPIIPQDHKKAAVLVLLYPSKGDWNVVLIMRKRNEGVHSGQVAFVGGRAEPDDENNTQTALRETEEEIGVSNSLIEVACALTQLYIPISNFMVFPFVGVLAQRPKFTLQKTEVEDVLEIPLAVFRNKANQKITNLDVGKGVLLEKVPYYDLNNNNILWGATAMMMAELVELLA